MSIPKIKLNDGIHIPSLGFGTYKLNGRQGTDAILQAMEMGYHLIDTAAKYENEEEVGKAIESSSIDRKDLFVTSKLWRDRLGYDEARKSFDESLARLKLDYLDLFLIHWPANGLNFEDWEKVNRETWKAFEDLRKEGKVRSIGVSNFLPHHLEALMGGAEIVPSVNQIEFHPGYWQEETVRYCNDRNIVIEAWSPLARGKVFDNDELNGIARKYNKTVAQVCLRWVIQHDAVVIPKSSSPERMRENADIFDFELSGEEMQRINELPEMGFSGEHPDRWEGF